MILHDGWKCMTILKRIGHIADASLPDFILAFLDAEGVSNVFIPEKFTLPIGSPLFSIELFWHLIFSLHLTPLNTAHHYLGNRCSCCNLLHFPQGSISLGANSRYSRCVWWVGASDVL